jgi:hypothetical protein
MEPITVDIPLLERVAFARFEQQSSRLFASHVLTEGLRQSPRNVNIAYAVLGFWRFQFPPVHALANMQNAAILRKRRAMLTLSRF